jgi:hypothetical protein
MSTEIQDIASMEAALAEAKKSKLDNCGFSKGNTVEVGGSKPFRGHIESLYVSSMGDDKGSLCMHIRGDATRSINWSSNLKIVREADFCNVSKIENPVNTETLERIDGLIYQKEREIKRATELLKKQKQRLEKLRTNQEKNCIHKFDCIGETGKIIKHLVGSSEEKEYQCIYCQKTVIDC